MHNEEQRDATEQENNAHLFEKWLQEADFELVQPQRGDILQGIIVQLSPTEILVDIGAKRDGIVNARDLERLPPEVRESLQEGEQVPVIVTRVFEDTGDVELSIAQALQEQDWVQARNLVESHEIIRCEVTGYNRGGLTVQFGRIRGFVPLSHVADIPRNLSPEQRAERMAEFVGTEIPVKVIEVDRARRRLILSHREAVRTLREQRRDELLTTLKEGDIVHGRVRSIADFGVFVDLDGVDGLIHRSELSWDRVDNIRAFVSVGQEVEAMVIKVDQKERKIGLSLKRLQPNPWLERVEKYQVGDIVSAVITNVIDFGAFAQVEEGVEGLIHISELGLGSKQRPTDVVQPGDEVKVKILEIDRDRQRISLSLRQAPQWEEVEETPEENSPPPGVPPTDRNEPPEANTPPPINDLHVHAHEVVERTQQATEGGPS